MESSKNTLFIIFHFQPFSEKKKKHFCSFVRPTPSDLFTNFFRHLTPSHLHFPPPLLLFWSVCMLIIGLHLPILLIPIASGHPFHPFHPSFLHQLFKSSLLISSSKLNSLRSDLYHYHLPELLWVTHNLTGEFNDFSFILFSLWFEISFLKLLLSHFIMSSNEISS